LRTGGASFNFGKTAWRGPKHGCALDLGLAVLAAFGIVPELLVAEKYLLSDGENEVRIAVNAL
jgi:hypothetical protein